MSLVAVLRDSVGTSYIVASRQIVVKIERSVLTKINEDVMLWLLTTHLLVIDYCFLCAL